MLINCSYDFDFGIIAKMFPGIYNILYNVMMFSGHTPLFLTKTDFTEYVSEATDKTSRFVYGIYITNKEYIDKYEPNTSSYKERLRILKDFSDKGYRSVAFYTPVYISEIYNTYLKYQSVNFMDIDLSDCYKVIDDVYRYGARSIQFSFQSFDTFYNKKIFPRVDAKKLYNVREYYDQKLKKYIYTIDRDLVRKILIELIGYSEDIFENVSVCKEPYINVLTKGKCFCTFEK